MKALQRLWTTPTGIGWLCPHAGKSEGVGVQARANPPASTLFFFRVFAWPLFPFFPLLSFLSFSSQRKIITGALFSAEEISKWHYRWLFFPFVCRTTAAADFHFVFCLFHLSGGWLESLNRLPLILCSLPLVTLAVLLKSFPRIASPFSGVSE